MLLPAHRVLHALNEEFARLQSQFADSSVDGSSSMAITTALLLLLNRESGGAASVHAQLDSLDATLAGMAAEFTAISHQVANDLGALRARIGLLKKSANLDELEKGMRDVLSSAQALLCKVNATAGVPGASKKAISHALTAWESADLLSQGASRKPGSGAVSTDITHANLTAYLRDRFTEPGLEVTTFQPLAGGFGKYTALFDVAGKALSGSFVMRRDMGERPTVDNDCHRARDEYPVIKAVFDRGFPGPDALWLDTEHKLLPGGDFFVMRRSPGRLAGNFFGAQTEVPASLAASLADVMARLHTLPPLDKLGDLTDSIRADRWTMTKGEVTERYIRDWYELYLRSEHSPSPALTAIYGWLLDNVPKRRGKPALLHGDIGFNNFLFDGDRLSAVLDWEFAHVGDPAEDLGYVKVTMGDNVNWEQLMARYIAGGGEPVDEKTLRYFQIWAYMRNATAANLCSALFINGHVNELKLTYLPVGHFPNFIRRAQALIDSY